MRIKIINGIYGLRVREGLVEPKTVNDAPFLVSDEEGARLIGLGVARQAEEAAENKEVAPVQPTATETVKDVVTITSSRDVQQLKSDVVIKYSENMKLDELKKIAVEVGASKAKVKNMRTKKEVIEVIEKKLRSKTSEDIEPQISAADFV